MSPVKLLLVITGERIHERSDRRLVSPADKVKVEHALDGPRLHAPYDRLGLAAEQRLAAARVDRVASRHALLLRRRGRRRRGAGRRGRGTDVLARGQQEIRRRELLGLGVGDGFLAESHRADGRHVGLRAEHVHRDLEALADLADYPGDSRIYCQLFAKVENKCTAGIWARGPK